MYTNVTWPLWLHLVALTLVACAVAVFLTEAATNARKDVRYWRKEYTRCAAELARERKHHGLAPPRNQPDTPPPGQSYTVAGLPVAPDWTVEHREEPLEIAGGVVQWNPGLAETGEMVVGDFLGGAA